MANKKSTLKPTRVEKQVSRLDTLSKKILASIDPSFQDRQSLTDQDAKLQKILADELNFAKGVSKGSIVDFVTSMSNVNRPGKNNSSEEVDATQLFTKDVGDIYSYFQDIYKNRFIEISDLKFITKFIPAIGEAVKTTLDSIVSADDITSSISRTLSFSSALTDDERDRVITEIERIEKEEKLLKKLKNIAYKKALVAGTSYIYHIPYAELFAEYDKRVKEGKINPEGIIGNPQAQNSFLDKRDKNPEFNLNANSNQDTRKGKRQSATESTGEEFFLTGVDISADHLCDAVEGFTGLNAQEKSIAQRAIRSGEFGSFYANDDFIITEALESVADIQYLDSTRSSPYYASYFGGTGEVSDTVDTEGAVDTNKSARPSKFNLSGTYIKFVDAKNMIPIKIYNTIVGYYYIHNTATAKRARTQAATNSKDGSLTASNQSLFNNSSLTEKKREQVVNDIVDVVANGILSSFSTRFVSKYSEHKKLIADCLVANGLINNDYSIQFIPAEYVTQFIINEDENGNGESMLLDSLFPAKMLLSYVVDKLLTYMNKGGNKTIAYVGKGPIDVGTSNHVQRVVRMLQESNITFNDLLSTNLVFSKFGRNNNLQLPKGKNGEKLIEFEVQEGQQVDMKTDMEEWLEKLAILGTGVPSVIMEYVDTADFSRSLVTANIKHASRVACYQSDLEDATTDFYRHLIAGSALDEELKRKAINCFEFKLARPRVLANANVAEYMSTLDQVTESIINMWMLIDNSNNSDDPDIMAIKAQMKKNYMIRNAPFLDIDAIEEDYQKARIQVIEKKDLDASDDNQEAGEEL